MLVRNEFFKRGHEQDIESRIIKSIRCAMYNCSPIMRTKSTLPVLSGAALLGAALFAATLFYSQRPAVSQTVPAGDSVLSFRIRFGVTDIAPKVWDGSLKVSGGGEALRIRNWRPRPGEKIDGVRGWSL